MTTTQLFSERIVRLALLPRLFPCLTTAVARPARSQWLYRPRFGSTSSPSNIASLLISSPLSPSSQPSASAGKFLTINGFVRTLRRQKRVAFAAIGDGSTMQAVQAVLSPEQADGLSTGAAVAVTGQWKSSPGKAQTHELLAETVRILGHNDAAACPLQKKYQTTEFLRSLPHLRSRLPFNSLLLRLRSQVTAQITNYLSTRDFVQVHPPIITSSDCEGAGEVFTVSPAVSSSPKCEGQNQSHGFDDLFFQSPKYLTVSSQLHLEALAQSVGKVWTLSPTFRAEKSDTPRHLSEFYMLEAEIAFAEDLADIMDVVEDLIRNIVGGLQASHVGKQLIESRSREHEGGEVTVASSVLAQRWQGLTSGPWPRITYNDAVRHLKNAVVQGKVQFAFDPGHQEGLQTEHERFLAESVGQGGPIFVTDYPRALKPFYMAPSKGTSGKGDDGPTASCFDLLVPEICELVGGSMREHRLAELLEAMDDHGLQRLSPSTSDYEASNGSLQWYLDLRRYGSVPHGGFGLGFDRLLCYLAGVSNIKDMVSFPRWHKRCDC